MDTKTYDTVTVERIGGAIGAVVEGVNLAADVSDQQFAELRHALAEHQVIFLRNQNIEADRQLEVAAHFGAPSVYPLQKMGGNSEPACSVIEDTAESPPTTDNWHTDVTWIADPPVAALLMALVVPPHGGNTMWTSTAAAYDDLSETMKGMLDGLEVVHTNWPHFCEVSEAKSGIEGLGQVIRDSYPDVVHPLVRTHPTTGRRSLFVTGRGDGTGVMKEVKGMTAAESRAILEPLCAHIDQPKYQCSWRWQPNDMAIWDERVTNHRGVSDHYPERRVMRRCTVDGERPYFEERS